MHWVAAMPGTMRAAQLPNLPVPDLPPLPKGASRRRRPVIGVLGVPEIMRAATTAAQQVEKVIAERREPS